jgi:hypothetical protein
MILVAASHSLAAMIRVAASRSLEGKNQAAASHTPAAMTQEAANRSLHRKMTPAEETNLETAC